MDRKWWTLIAVCFGTFMLLLDITVVNVALPDIQQSLHSSFADLQWVIDAYALTLAAFLLTAGVVGDTFGRRGVYAIGLAIFTLSSLLCGVSTSSLMLNLARALQGVGGAVMFATALALIAQAFAGKERGTAFGVYGAVVGGAVAVGPLIGGAITSGIGWRWIFFVNLPIGVAAFALTLARVEPSKDPTHRRIDWIGFLTFSASLFMLVFALVQGNARGWTSPVIVGTLVGSGVCMALFLVAELLQRDPMLDLSLFKRPAMVGVSLGSFTLSASIFAMFLYLTIYLQEVLGYGPFQAGIRFLPITMLSFLVAPIAGKLTVRVKSRYLMGLGLILVAFGCELMSHVQADSTWTVLLPGFVVAGVGVGITNPVLASSSVSVVPPQRSGMASGSASTFRQVGIATGIAGLGAVFLSQIRPNTATVLANSAAGRAVLEHGGSRLSQAIAGNGVRQAAAAIPVPAVRTALIDAYKVGYVQTFNHLMVIATVVAAIGAVGCLALVRQRDFVPSYAPAPDVPATVGGGEPPAGEPAGAEVPGALEPELEPVPDSSLPHDPMRRPTRTGHSLASRRHR
jgi:EmrB/QacA subfamily drug resistance transporter